MAMQGEAHGTEGGVERGAPLAAELEGVDPAELARAAARFATEHPHAALAGAFAAGFLLGGGLTPRIVVSLAALAGRRYAAQAVRELLASAVDGEAEPAQA